MLRIDQVFVNGQQSTSTAIPTIAGLRPVIAWDLDDEAPDVTQKEYELRIGSSISNIGTEFFVGDKVNITTTTSSSSYSYPYDNLTRGNTYFGQVKATDIYETEAAWYSFSFKINQLPGVIGYYLTPSSPVVTDEITLTYRYYDDDDQEESGTKIRWYKNNIYQSNYDDLLALPRSANVSGDSWTAKIIPSDGLEFGRVFETGAVSLSSPTESTIAVTLLPAEPMVDDILYVTYTYDTETINPSSIIIEWYLNDVELTDYSNQQYIRTILSPDDRIYVVVKLEDDAVVLAQGTSTTKLIADSVWHVYDVTVNGLQDATKINDLVPIVEWKHFKSNALSSDRPDYTRVLVTKTESVDGPLYDSGFIENTKNSFVIPENILDRGSRYYIHIVVSDSTEPAEDLYATKLVQTAGSSWADNVSNTTGWTIEFNLSINSTNVPFSTSSTTTTASTTSTSTANMGVLIHDGTYFCALKIGMRSVSFFSESPLVYTFLVTESDMQSAKTFKISARGQNVKIFMNNRLIINAVGLLTSLSGLKTIEYGDIDSQNTNTGTFKFFRYSTNGAYGFGDNLPDENTFYFYEIAEITGGNIQYIFENLISWLPDDETESAKLIQFNENADKITLPTVTRNFSPITSIYIDNTRNKYIGTANGVSAIYGEKHDADYEFITSTGATITEEDFDLISNAVDISLVQPAERADWFTINTTFEAAGTPAGENPYYDPYDPYSDPYTMASSHAIHYYTQRAHGHEWYDNVDNAKGWSVSFSLNVERIEADLASGELNNHEGFGVYINDGTYQEVVYFYEDRIRLFYANVYASLSNTYDRDFAIVGKGQNLFIYQKLANAPFGSYNKIIDGAGLFSTPATKSGNSSKSKVIRGSSLNTYHSVWHDDGNGRSQIMYSTYNGSAWSDPELVTVTTQFHLRNPDLALDSTGRVWVAYEDTSWGNTEISISVLDNAGWNPRVRLTNSFGVKRTPTIQVDSDDNVHVAWEDDRNGNSVIMWALWNNETQTWNSSGQFGEDTIIMQFYSEDPYQDPYGPDEYNEYGDSKPMAFKCPKLTMNYPRLYIIAEADFVETNQSMIYGGYYDLLSKIWNSSGSTILENGEAIGTGSGFLISPISANAKNPSVASSFSGDMAVCWEDHSAAIVQVGVALMDMYGAIYDHYVNITNSIDNNCTNPAVGWSTNYAFIAYEKNNNINILTFNSSTHSFSATTSINTEEGISCRSPAMPEYLISGTVMCTYESSNQSDSEYLSNAELQNYYTINSATISGTGPVYVSSSTLVSSLDTKEFAFGDFSDIAGLKSHWKDFKFYFGYDAHPYSISKFNKTTISNWPDDRVNDVFVDVFGNIIAATFGGLVYHNVITGKSTIIEELKDKTITAITWGGNGIWFTGTTNGAYLSADAGQTWQQFVGSGTIYAIAADNLGRATVASSEGVIVYDPSTAATVATISLSAIAGTSAAKSVAVDENNIIWAGTDKGLVRIENFTNFLLFSRKNGMRSSHINDIAIVNKHLRYIATPSGIERMYGVNFTNMNVNNAELLNDNVLTVRWHGLTNSLWAGCLYKLHEIVFRDQAHEIIENEVVYYDNTEISTENTLDTSVYYVLDLDSIQSDSSNPLKLTTETTSVYLNKHKIDAGYTVDEIGQTVEFSTELLVSDQVEIEISNRFTKYHDFNQFDIEKEVLGEKRTSILKMDRTSQNQLLVMSDIDKHSLMFLADEQARLPFCTILLDKDPPIGCLEKIDQITKTQLKFRIYAYDELSGVESYMLSNYANFTSDGTTELEFQPLQSLVVHDIGSNINNVYDSLVFPDTVEIEGTTYTVGTGSSLGAISFYANQNITLFAGTSGPSIVFRYDTTEETWEAVVNLDVGDLTRRINDMQTINNVLWITTGTDVGNGGIYRTFDGVVFELVQSVTGTDARGIAATSEGSIYFGSSDGKLYKYKNNVMSQEFGGEAVADSIYSLAIMQDKLIIGTGNKGRIYTIDLTTNNSLIIFSGADTHINNVLIQGAETGSTDTAQLFATSGNNTTIYRSNLTSFDFAKSYTSVGEDMGRLRSITTNTVTDQATTGSTATVAGNSVLAAIGSKLFKYTSPSWQYFYQHDETINDFMEYSPGDKSAVWIISDSKVTKWTNTLTTKTVYLRLKDKAGNITPAPMTDTCPVEGSVICCDTQDETTQQAIAGVAYSINIEDLKDFVNESRIVDVSEYGEVTFTYSSPYQNLFYSADKIDEEIGIYTSEVLNGSNDLVSWKSIAWVSVEPSETSVEFQIRSAISEDLASEAEWSEVLTGGNVQEISLEHITDQYMQFRAVLKSKVRNSSPSLSSVVLRSITSQASHFFTTNFVMPSRPTKGLLTANTFIPVSSDIVFGINTTNSTNFSEYQQIEVNRLFSLTNDQFGSNLRIGAKLLSPAASSINPTVYPGSEYDESSYVCSIDFNYTNPSSSDSNLFHFRAKFYSDVSRTLLSYTFFSSNDQTGWTYDGSVAIPGTGVSLSASETQAISFTPGDQVDATIKWYVEIDAYYDGSFTNISDNKSFVCTTATEYEYENPKIYNFALVFELENGDHVKLNLT